LFTQSVEPGNGTSTTRNPACVNQLILVATADGAAAALTVRAQNPTRTLFSARADVVPSRATRHAAAIMKRVTALLLLVRLHSRRLSGTDQHEAIDFAGVDARLVAQAGGQMVAVAPDCVASSRRIPRATASRNLHPT